MKSIIDCLKKGKNIIYLIFFIFFFLSFYLNLFHIIPEKRYKEYETFVEALVVGKMAKAQEYGAFSASGFTGVNYDKSLVADSILKGDQINDLLIRDHIIIQFKDSQLDFFLKNEAIPNDYCPYVSHSGGNALFWYSIHKVLPFDNYTNYQILRLINCILLSLCFVIFIGWFYRNWGFVAAFTTFILTFLSSWLVLFGGNGLWWSLWNFYVPFLTVLLLLEKKHNHPSSVSTKKLLVALFFAFLVKLCFSGLEFISTAALSIFVPIVYYAILERWKFIQYIKLSFQSGLIAGGAIVMQFALLIIQLRYLLGSYNSAYQYIAGAFFRRTSFQSGLSGADLDSERFADSHSLSFLWNNVIKDYLRGNIFEWEFITLPFETWFAVIIGIIIIAGIFVYVSSVKLGDSKYLALVATTFLSAICPLSWYVIFKEHSFWHPQIDFIIWYMPFLLLGFGLIGVAIKQGSVLLKR